VSACSSWTVHSLHCTSRTPLSGDAADVVFIHGHTAGAALWANVIDHLAPHARVHLLDLPGWGRSQLPQALEQAADPTDIVRLHVEMLVGWLHALQLRRVVLVGHSYGAIFSAHLAHAAPWLLHDVILVAPGGLTPIMPRNTFTWGIYFKFISPQVLARCLGRVGLLIFRRVFAKKRPAENPAVGDYYYQLAAATHRAGKGDRVMARFVGFRASLSPTAPWTCIWTHPMLSVVLGIQCRLTVVWGAHDFLVPPFFGPLLQRCRPGTSLHVLEGGSHNPAHSVPRQFCDVITGVLHESGVPSREQLATLHVPRGVRSGGVFLTAYDAVRSQLQSCSADGLSTPPPLDTAATAVSSTGGSRGDSTATACAASPLSAAAMAAGHAALPDVFGTGKGFCAGCDCEVHLFAEYWRCHCGKWSYVSYRDTARTQLIVDRMLAFLDELYVSGTFDARKSAHIDLLPMPSAAV
jgi:pimeloyl-ACP methyl ester carboxylesterase